MITHQNGRKSLRQPAYTLGIEGMKIEEGAAYS